MAHRIVIPDPGESQLTYWTAPERSPRPKNFVYVIQVEGDSPIKVGTEMDVRVRMRDLQTGNPRPLRLRAVLPGSYGLEQALHQELAGDRLVGEWFDGRRIDGFLRRLDNLAKAMMVRYRRERRVPSFTEFSPYKERLRQEWRPPVVMPFETPPIGRLSSARRSPTDTSPQREAERERRASEELAWVMDPKRIREEDDLPMAS